ncbi:hypothetical protein KUTeg_019195 [Tegillarca granosa]|uniref:Malonyl-CoA:ACP transacylase (MAT) domain-containing protein n=1 Tax=Tegillarca granosa TaxID=220873 RepID=A0ABQ9EBT7_TEGGR|nr:hypothetical protein KUTeg_019195 [Tegillarca granosa]
MLKKTKRTYCSKEDDSENKIGVNTIQSEDDLKRIEKDLEKLTEEETKELSEKSDTFNLFSLKKPVLDSDFPSDVKEYQKKYDQWKQYQAKYSFRPNKDPTETSIILFPGQGSQYVGMGEKLLFYPGVPELFEIASDILEYDLLHLCLNGPKEELDKTVHCQPAIFVTSLAAIKKLEEDNPEILKSCIGTAGLSVGEYAAIVFAEIMDFRDALSVLKVRAEKMQEASEMVPSGMMTVLCNYNSKLGLAMEAAKQFCKERLEIERPALDFIKDNAEDFGLKGRIKPLPVSGAFHTSLMQPAVKDMYKALDKATINRSRRSLRVHSNYNGKDFRPRDILQILAQQIVKPVKWEQTMHVLYMRPQGTNFPQTYEAGPGNSLGKIIKRINLKAYENYHNIET